MAIVLEANYAKKLGLPGYSSHQYSVSIRTELTDLSQVEAHSAQLYRLLQDAVDDSIQHSGYLPAEAESTPGLVSGGVPRQTHPRPATAMPATWRCSDKQRELIEKIIEERRLDKAEVEQLAQDLFGVGVRQLDRLQASGLIDELFERHGGKPARRSSSRTPHSRRIAA